MKKKIIKPWLLQFQWKSAEDFEKYSYKARNHFYEDKWWSGTTLYVSPDKAAVNLRKWFLDEIGNITFRGRNWRLYNKREQKILSVEIKDKTIILT